MSETPTATPAEPQRKFRHIRLVVALAVASLLGTFAVYTAIADTSIPVLGVAQASAYTDQKIRLEGKVAKSTGDPAGVEGLRFTLRDYQGSDTVEVVYRGSVPDAYRVGRDIVIDGTLKNGVLQAVPDSLVTKCPSKYEDKATTSPAAS